jgi:arginyl-tRNA synthetase
MIKIYYFVIYTIIGFLISGENVSPNAVAKRVVECLEKCDIIEKVDVSGPGFINVWLGRNKLRDILQFILDNGLKAKPTVNKQKIVIDFSSPNVAKEMHVGHLRSVKYVS